MDNITSFVHSNREQAFLLGDYATYRTQLSRQVLAVRRKLKIVTPKGQKYSKKAPLTADDVAKDKEYVHLQLLASERAWAHAMSTKSVHAQEDDTISGPTRKFIISRLNKAYAYATNLVSVLKNKSLTGASDQDILEAQAYARCLEGSIEFEKQFSKRFDDQQAQKIAWRSCLVSYSEAHVIYTALLGSTQKDLFKEVIAGAVDPSIRYAAYQSRLSRTIPIAKVAKQHFRRDQKELLDLITKFNPAAFGDETAATSTTKDSPLAVDIPTTVTWRGRTAPIADASVGQALAATSIASAQLQKQLSEETDSGVKALANLYDPVLTAAQDTVDAVRRALADLAKEGVPESDARIQDLRVTDLAANYALISWRIGRNRVLASSAASSLDDGLLFVPQRVTPRARPAKDGASHPQPQSKPATRSQRLAVLRDRTTMYASTLQSVDTIAALPGASRDPGFMAELDAQRAYFSALRCLNVGYSHTALGRGHEREALALYARAAELAHESRGAAKAPLHQGPPTLAVSADQVQQLTRHITALVDRQRGLVTLRQYADARKGGDDNVTEPPFMIRLDTYPDKDVDLANLVPYPPRLEPVPVKPIFLDLAWNYIAYPGQETQTATETSAQGVGKQDGEKADDKKSESKSRGWFGFGR